MKSERIPRWLGTREVAERLGLSVSYVRELIRDGTIPARRHKGRTLRVDAADLAAYMNHMPRVTPEGEAT